MGTKKSFKKNVAAFFIQIFAAIVRVIAPAWAIEKGIYRSRCHKGRWQDNEYACLFCPSAKKVVKYFKTHTPVSEAFLCDRVWSSEVVSALFSDRNCYCEFKSNDNGEIIKEGYCFNFHVLAPRATESDLDALLAWAPDNLFRKVLANAKTPRAKWLVNKLTDKKQLTEQLVSSAPKTLNGLSLQQLISLLPNDNLDNNLATLVDKEPERWAVDMMNHILATNAGKIMYSNAYNAVCNSAFKKVNLSKFMIWFSRNDTEKFSFLLNRYEKLENRETYLLQIIKAYDYDDPNEEGLWKTQKALYIAEVNNILRMEVEDAPYRRDETLKLLSEIVEEIVQHWTILKKILGKDAIFSFVAQFSDRFKFLLKKAETEEEKEKIQSIIISRGPLYSYYPFTDWTEDNKRKAIQTMVDNGTFPTERLKELPDDLQKFATEQLQVASEMVLIAKEPYELEKIVESGAVFCPEAEAALVTRDFDSACQTAIIKYITMHKMSLQAFRRLSSFRSSYGIDHSRKRVQAHIDTWGLDGPYLEALQASQWYKDMAGAYTAKKRGEQTTDEANNE